MPEPRRAFDKILNRTDEDKAFTEERQHAAQAFTLHIEWKDGRRSEGFAWAHYSGYRWADNSDSERLVLFFGDRAIEVEGNNLGVLVEQLREGKLTSIREMHSSKQMLLNHSNDAGEPLISAIRSYPDLEELLREIKGEGDDKADMLDGYSDDELKEVKAPADRLLVKRDDERKADAMEAARATLAAVGLTLKDLAKAKAKPVKGPQYKGGHSYQHPTDKTLVWAAKGKKPNWLTELEGAGGVPVEMANEVSLKKAV